MKSSESVQRNQVLLDIKPVTHCRTLDERTTVYFSENPPHLLEAYADSGEGLDRAGGFAIQVGFPSCHRLPHS
jgi:predicted house-cleaning NTP pyrophosphatase (Maf/HAM1 superfamily)